MTATNALLDECLANREDDEPRLVWGDAIGGERGELVGLQCGRHAIAATAMPARNRRERELLAAHEMAWSGLAGLATRVRFRRGFVDAIEISVDAWLESSDLVLERAPFLTSLTLVGAHPSGMSAENRASARVRLERSIKLPAFRAIRALDVCDRTPLYEYPWGDDAMAVLGGAGTLAQLEAFAVPVQMTIAAVPAFVGGRPANIDRLWLRDAGLRDTTLGRDELATMLAATPKLDELDVRSYLLDPRLVLPRLTSLRLGAVTADHICRLAESPLAGQLERLVLDVSQRSRDRMQATQVDTLASFKNLRVLELPDEMLAMPDALEAFAQLRLPALRELSLSWTESEAALVRVIEHFGPQLERLDLRRSQRMTVTLPACDVLVDEPSAIELVHASLAERASWYVPGDAAEVGPYVGACWLVQEVGPEPGRVWDLGMLGDRRIRIGRGQFGDVLLRHGSIARTHATIEWRGDVHLLRDMKSTNGVVIDGQRVDRVPMFDGMRFTLGSCVLRFFVGAGGGRRATECVRTIATTDPVTGFRRQTRREAARIRIYDVAGMIANHGEVIADAVIAAVAQRLREAASPEVAITTPARGEFGIYPPEPAEALWAAVKAPVDIEGCLVHIQRGV